MGTVQRVHANQVVELHEVETPGEEQVQQEEQQQQHDTEEVFGEGVGPRDSFGRAHARLSHGGDGADDDDDMLVEGQLHNARLTLAWSSMMGVRRVL